jgi:hypothetical protein
MSGLDYSAAGVPVREDLRETHRSLWEHVTSPGTWWTGTERVAIAEESRAALACSICRARKEALSPGAVSGEHDAIGKLPPNVVDAIHRVRTDPARLSRAWFDGVLGSGLEVTRYVELIGVVTLVAGVDFCLHALGIPAFPLPEPRPGAPSRARPAGAKPGPGWVPTIAAEDAVGPEEGLYGDPPVAPHIVRALSLVPDEVRALRRSSNATYVPMSKLMDPRYGRDLDRMQIELVAARVSALNECFY